MKVLVINNGSTSARFSIFDIDTKELLASGGVEGIGTDLSYYKYENNRGDRKKVYLPINNGSDVLPLMFSDVFDTKIGVLKTNKEISVIGHRIVHGGEKYTKATFIDDNVLKDIENLSVMAPMHNSSSIETIRECQKLFKLNDNVAVFDTSFHLTIPKENYLYAIPKEFYEKYKIRKYGFHGISYNYVLKRYCTLTNTCKNDTNIIVCHLGGGSSICAIKNGKSFDTTMGNTPLSGLMMASRSGSIDPAIISNIMKIKNISIEDAIDILYNQSGYYAICNSKNMENIVEKSKTGNKDAILLRNMIDKDFKRYLLGMMANLSNVDAIIVTGGIGSKNKEQREMLLSNLEQFGIFLDRKKNNQTFNQEAIISADESKIPIYVIPSNEEKEIADQAIQLIKIKNKKAVIRSDSRKIYTK